MFFSLPTITLLVSVLYSSLLSKCLHHWLDLTTSITTQRHYEIEVVHQITRKRLWRMRSRYWIAWKRLKQRNMIETVMTLRSNFKQTAYAFNHWRMLYHQLQHQRSQQQKAVNLHKQSLQQTAWVVWNQLFYQQHTQARQMMLVAVNHNIEERMKNAVSKWKETVS